jgi:hypothetical protein
MASAVTINKLKSNLAVTQYDFDPDSADKVDAAWVDMRDFGRFMAGFFRTVGTGALDTFRIIANAASDGSGTDVEVIAHALPSGEPNAVGDTIWVECTADQIREVGTAAGVEGLRYVSLNLEFATSTDEGVVTYIRSLPRWPRDGLTANVVA